MKNLIKLLHERSGRLTAKHPTAERFDTYKMGRTVAHISTQYTLNTDQGRKGTYYCERTWYFTESIESPRPYVASDKQSVLKTVPANNEMMIDAAESLDPLTRKFKRRLWLQAVMYSEWSERAWRNDPVQVVGLRAIMSLVTFVLQMIIFAGSMSVLQSSRILSAFVKQNGFKQESVIAQVHGIQMLVLLMWIVFWISIVAEFVRLVLSKSTARLGKTLTEVASLPVLLALLVVLMAGSAGFSALRVLWLLWSLLLLTDVGKRRLIQKWISPAKVMIDGHPIRLR